MLKRLPELTAGLLSIIIGGLIYLLFRPETLTMFSWLKAIGAEDSIHSARLNNKHLATTIPDWIVFSAPNGLWVFSFGLIMTFIWGGNRCSQGVVLTTVVFISGMASELLQISKLIPGTFDYFDLLAYAAGFAGYVFLLTKREKNDDV